jgi:RHS repeat-associated protein
VLRKRQSFGATFSFARKGGIMTNKLLPGNEGNVIYTYDSSASANSLGRLSGIEDSSQKKEFGYDKLGNRNKESRRLKNITNGDLEHEHVTRYQYDLSGRTVKIEYPIDIEDQTAATVCYGYNGFGLVSSAGLTWAHGDCSQISTWIVSNTGYNEFRQVEFIKRGNGVSTTYEYDIKGRITRMVSQGMAASTGGLNTIQDARYSYHVNNSIKGLENLPQVNGVEESQVRFEYTYDGLNRLTAAKGQYALQGFGSPNANDKSFFRKYQYSANGNLTAKEERDFSNGNIIDKWSYSYDNHMAASIATIRNGQRFTMAYDAAGNMISKGDNSAATGMANFKSMEYDSNNRMIKVTNTLNGNEIGKYWYDDQGFRVRRISSKIDGSKTGLFYINRYYGFERQINHNGQEVPGTHHAVNNIYLNGVRIAAVTAKGQTRYFLSDQVDSVQAVMDESGKAISRSEYLPYGETWVQSGDTKNLPKFNGQELDTESGFYYFNERHYDPQLARFVTADTVVDGAATTAGWNRYMFVHGNPVMYKDPSGHFLMGGSGGFLAGLANALGIGDSGVSSSPDNATKAKVESVTSKSMDSGNTRPGPIQKEMIDNFKTYMGKDKNGKTITWNSTTMGGVIVDLGKNVTKESIKQTSEETLSAVNDMIKENKLTKLTISSLARENDKNSPHEQGRGIDITEAWRGKEYTKFNNEKGEQENQLAKDITNYLMDDKKSNFTQVLTPWKIKDGVTEVHPNKWQTDMNADRGLAYDHRHHLHITGSK